MTQDKHSILWYIAGPMSWLPGFNVQSFLDTQIRLAKEGYLCQLPADLDDPTIVQKLLASPDGNPEDGASGMTWGDCLALDVKLISDVCGGVAVMHGWKRSRGARLETFTAYLTGKPVVYAKTMKKVPDAELFDAWKGEKLR